MRLIPKWWPVPGFFESLARAEPHRPGDIREAQWRSGLLDTHHDERGEYVWFPSSETHIVWSDDEPKINGWRRSYLPTPSQKWARRIIYFLLVFVLPATAGCSGMILKWLLKY